LLVFRDTAGQARSSSARLLGAIQDLLDERVTAGEPHQEPLTNALLRGGEIECALADLSHKSAITAALLTGALARQDVASAAAALHALRSGALPDSLTVTAPEGFAYYALDPFRYADLVRTISDGNAFVIGIRSIGTVLSAVCAVALGCERMTVRPAGHPYDRELQFDDAQRSQVRHEVGRSAEFFVVDEGPGLSGSSFLATAEALEREGVARDRIVLLGSRECAGRDLVARDAASRWARHRYIAVPSSGAPTGSRPFRDWDWRRESSLAAAEWPATWSQLTPPKYIANDGQRLWKYEGRGRAGDEVRSRGAQLAAAGYSPEVIDQWQGFTAYRYIEGEALSAGDWDQAIGERIAEYLAFRAREFRNETDATLLTEMTRHNVRALLGVEIGDFQLEVVRPCVCDARLMPHEWLRAGEGQVLKTDATMHGDNHFFPGPCDIAWDVAGAVIEWQLDAAAEEELIACYKRLSDDDVRSRLAPYKIAYAAFRAAFAQMAAHSMPGSAEAQRFERDQHKYLDRLRAEILPFTAEEKIYSIA
jgi:hypothetical protein